MSARPLFPHRRDAVQSAVPSLVASVDRVAPAVVRFEYRLTGNIGRLAIPQRQGPRRADRLWEHTCFEAFIAPAGGSRYLELNFSPSSEWAAYAFADYRQGMQLLALPTPHVVVVEAAGELSVTADVELDALDAAPWPWRIGLTAVVEDRAGSKGYYALAHAGEKPDFHDAAGFLMTLDGSVR